MNETWNLVKSKVLDTNNFINLAERDGIFWVYACRAGKIVETRNLDRDIAESNYQTLLDDFTQNIDI